MKDYELTLVIEKDSDANLYVGQLLEYPEVISEAATIEELKENIIDAFKLYSATHKELFFKKQGKKRFIRKVRIAL